MIAFTLDQIPVELKYDNINPDQPFGGMRPTMLYLWIKLPTGWVKAPQKSSVTTKDLIEKSTLEQLTEVLNVK